MSQQTTLYRLLLFTTLSLAFVVISMRPQIAQVSEEYRIYLPNIHNPRRVLPPPESISTQLYATFSTDTITGIHSVGDGRLFVSSRAGLIYIVNPDGTVASDTFLNISPKLINIDNWELGMLGTAFHPNFPEVPYLYVTYTSYTPADPYLPQEERHFNMNVSRFTVDPNNPNQVDPTTELNLLTIFKTAHNSPVHNGGDLTFGPDGYLYIAFGTGGPDPVGHERLHDPHNNGYRTNTLWGKILRIDVNGQGQPALDAHCGLYRNYTIPPDNPFADGDASNCDEIWAKGLRNPWRISFDRLTGDLFISDVGEWEYEEINLIPAGSGGGQDFGWRCFEGTYDHRPPHPIIANDCAPNPEQDYTWPIYQYNQNEGCSVTGGFLYRGEKYPRLWGHYVFGDFCNGTIKVLSKDMQGNWSLSLVQNSSFHISTFGQDANGELFLGQWSSSGMVSIFELQASPTH